MLRQIPHRRRGSVLLYQTVALIVLIAFASLAVDFGRVQSVKLQLRCAADAAALAATDALQRGNLDPTAVAIAAAAENVAAGSSVEVRVEDVEYGHWNAATQSFVGGGLPIDAVHVTARRTTARGNAIPLIFGNVIGQATCNVNGDAVSRINPQIPNYAFSANSNFVSRGLLTTDSYPATGQGNIYCNNDITLNLLGLVGLTLADGDVRPGPGGSIHKPLIGVTNITGSTSQLGQLMSFPPVDPADFAGKNDNASLPTTLLSSGNDFTTVIGASIPGGTYVVHDLNILAGVALRLDGPTTFYVTGRTNILASIQVRGNDPGSLRIRVANSGTVTLGANLSLYMDLYAPQSTVNVAAGGNYYGAMVGDTVNILGTALMHYQTTLSREKLPSSSIVR